jgi:hypothetical protein
VDAKLAPVNIGPYNLNTDRSSKNEQLLAKPFLWETKNTNLTGGGKLKFPFCFMETTHEALHLDK